MSEAETEKAPSLSLQEDMLQVPIEVTVSIGKAFPTIREVIAFETNTVLDLDRRIDDPVDLYVGNRLVAKGTLEERTDNGDTQLSVRLTELIAENRRKDK